MCACSHSAYGRSVLYRNSYISLASCTDDSWLMGLAMRWTLSKFDFFSRMHISRVMWKNITVIQSYLQATGVELLVTIHAWLECSAGIDGCKYSWFDMECVSKIALNFIPSLASFIQGYMRLMKIY